MQPQQIWHEQRTFFSTGNTLPLTERLKNLKRLELTLIAKETEILNALREDLGKPRLEAYSAEVGFVLQELRHARKHLRRWIKPKRKLVPFYLWPGSSELRYQPKGHVLILSPWNYPLQLALSPLVAALAAGNVVILKPSEHAKATSTLLRKLIEEIFEPKLVAVIEGDHTVATKLLDLEFDHIFFTGSTHVGRIVMEKAAKHLATITLELGGKSPVIIDETADLKVAARRVAWGKFFNAGQTCVAPDYAVVASSVYEPFLQHLKNAIVEFYGMRPEFSPDYGRIINDRHFDRLKVAMNDCKILYGGDFQREKLYISPTVVANASSEGLANQEIFGPILPVISVPSKNSIFETIEKHPNPLALYVFSRDKDFVNRVIERVACGGVTVNDTLLQAAISDVPFGGVRQSGQGRYHGFEGFREFSNQKSIVRRGFGLDFRLRYPPYGTKFEVIKRLLRWP